MKLINLLLLLLPLTGFSQYDKWIEADSVINGNVKIVGNKSYTWKRPKPKLFKTDTIAMSGYTCFGCDSTEFIIGYNRFITGDTFPSLKTNGNATYFESYNTSRWYFGYYNETKKGSVETPINVMDTGLKIETVETRDTVYKCPQTYGITLLVYDSNSGSLKAKDPNCTVEKIVTTRRYKLYIINEYGQKEYLSIELSKQK